MEKTKKVLQMCNYFLGTKLFNTLFSELNNSNFENHIYCPSSNVTPVGWNVEGEKVENLTVSKCFSNIDRFFFKTKSDKILKDMENIYDLSEFDLIYAHSVFSSGFNALRIKQKYGTPYIVAVCNTDVNTFFKYGVWLRALGKKIILEAEKVIFISPSYEEYVCNKYFSESEKKLLNNKIAVIPFGVDELWLENKRKRTLSDRKNVTIVSTGRVEPNKNQLLLIDACEKLNKKGYNIKLMLIGRKTDDKYLEKCLSREFVSYLGEKTHKEMMEIYKECDIYAMPSVYETFGLVYGEAMSQGLPVIYSKGQGFDQQFENGVVGYSVNSRNSEEIGLAIEKVIDNYEAMSEKCYTLCEKFRWLKIAQKYIELFTDVCKSKEVKQ